MREIENTDDTEHGETAIEVGLSVRTYSPTMAFPESVIEGFKNENEEDREAVYEQIGNWWDGLSTEERAEVMNLDEKDGGTMIENLMFIDSVDDGREVITEW